MSGPGDEFYEAAKHVARPIKIVLQMIVGIGIVLAVSAKFGADIGWNLSHLKNFEILKIVGYGLSISAAIELSYMLFTPGPDEAIEPIILGVAAVILIVASADKPGVAEALAILCLSVAVAILFYVRKHYLPHSDD